MMSYYIPHPHCSKAASFKLSFGIVLYTSLYCNYYAIRLQKFNVTTLLNYTVAYHIAVNILMHCTLIVFMHVLLSTFPHPWRSFEIAVIINK